jgi:hypothetical protein
MKRPRASISPVCACLLLTGTPAAALAAELLHTAAGAESEAAVSALVGRPTGVTLTAPGGMGGACVFTGRGSYRLDESGMLSIQVEENCAGITNLGSLPICGLSPDLQCSPGGRFPHQYRVTGAALAVDSREIPWLPSPAPSVPQLLHALKARIAAEQDLARAERSAAQANPDGLVVRCQSPHASFMVRSNLSSLMQRQQRPDPSGLCADSVLQRFLSSAHGGDPVAPDSAVGRCFAAAGMVTDWTVTRCAVADQSAALTPAVRTVPAQAAAPVDGPAGYQIACAIGSASNVRSCDELASARLCDNPSNYASPPSTDRTGVTFVNRSAEPLEIYWLSFHGEPIHYRHLPPGERAVQQTFIGHNWLVTRTAGQCIGVFKAAPQSIAFF